MVAIKLILLLYAFFLLLAIGTDGWFRIETLRSDSAWFMMAGKSWMEGLRPYADFSDSKGPLLWLIYGLGYLISPRNYHGVFVLEVLAYWLTFIILFKTARIFLKDTGRSLVAVFLMAFIYFYPAMHQQMRAEDFCHVFQAYMLYVVIETLYAGSFRRVYFFWAGVALGCTLLIKYSYFLTLLVPLIT